MHEPAETGDPAVPPCSPLRTTLTPAAPGPFSMADEPMVRQQLEAVGYEAIAFQRVDATVG